MKRINPRALILTGVATVAIGVAVIYSGLPSSAPSTQALVAAPIPTHAERISPSPSASPTAHAVYVFPVLGKVSYSRDHHDYPATDIMAPCGTTVVAVTDGVILEVTRVNTYDPKVDAGPTRGGLSVSILGNDGVRYYGSHFSSITTGIEPKVKVRAGQVLGKVGRTGAASACHLHLGISPPCALTNDWFNRRGLIWPWRYLDSWRSRGASPKSPVAEVAAWKAKNGCPTKPLVYP